ncbi:MAG TPA: GTPase Era [Alphaproteobacteria bacterium]|nr:GTPase Era [Alphaproteobacteria bacterium]USO05048.1 MAG: GTPase Era [Rhodospirillales bacterium]HOO81702.1 GTPase Era [Alphaproteobacteria bacterium]
MSTDRSEETRCGFVSVVGLPNAGKSTLINQLVGTKVSIVSSKVHTTRSRILGIALHDQAQIILIDTPGIFDAGGARTMEKAMVASALDALEDSECVIHIVDAASKNTLNKNANLIKKLPKNKPVILVLNKTDKVHKPDLLALATSFNDAFDYAATFMVSSLKGQGTKELLDHLAAELKPGPWMYDEDQITDLPMRMMAAEITREKIFNQLHKELPYSAMVQTETWEEFDNGSIKITQLVFVERDSQKAIVLGKGGTRIKQIGKAAREEMQDIFGMPVHLKLFVKVEEKWAERSENLREMRLLS